MTRVFIKLFLGLLVSLLIAMTAGAFIYTRERMRQFEEESPPPAKLGMAVLIELGNERSLEEFEVALARVEASSGIGVRLISPQDPAIPVEVRARLAEGTLVSLSRAEADGLGDAGLISLVPVPHHERIAVVGPLFFDHTPTIQTWLVLVFVLLLGVSITTYLISSPVVARLRDLEAAAKALADGDLETRVEAVDERDAVGLVGKQFNTMAERIQFLLESRTQLIQAVAHELRTPISRIRFSLEMLALAESPEGQEEREAAIIDELAELDSLVEELVVFIRHDSSGSITPTKTKIDVESRVRAQVERFTATQDDERVEVVIDLTPSTLLCAHPRAFDRVVHNLLSNALRYSEEKVFVHVHAVDGVLTVRVTDSGGGIPESDHERVFDPFTRLDASRSRTSGGVGLGLAIVKRIMEKHLGTVRIEEGLEGGASLVTEWPLC